MTADTILGEYSVQSFDANETFHALGRHKLGSTQQTGFKTMEDAKAAAEAFYMSMIMSTLRVDRP